MSTTETVNIRAAGANATSDPASAKLLGTATLNVPDERSPNDLSWIAPLVRIGDRFFSYVPQAGFGPTAASEYVEVVPVSPVSTSVYV